MRVASRCHPCSAIPCASRLIPSRCGESRLMLNSRPSLESQGDCVHSFDDWSAGCQGRVRLYDKTMLQDWNMLIMVKTAEEHRCGRLNHRKNDWLQQLTVCYSCLQHEMISVYCTAK